MANNIMDKLVANYLGCRYGLCTEYGLIKNPISSIPVFGDEKSYFQFFQAVFRKKMQILEIDLGLESKDIFRACTNDDTPVITYSWSCAKEITPENIEYMVDYCYKELLKILDKKATKIFWRTRPEIEKIEHPLLGEGSSQTMRVYTRFALE